MDQKKVIQKNDEYVIEITDLGSDGEGIGKILNPYTAIRRCRLYPFCKRCIDWRYSQS